MDTITATCAALRRAARERDRDASSSASSPLPRDRDRHRRRSPSAGCSRSSPAIVPTRPGREADPAPQRVIADWQATGHAGGDALRSAACRALARVASALLVRHGRIWGSREMIAALATDIACNDLGASEIGRLLEPLAAGGGRCRGLPAAAAAGAAGGHEHQGSVGLGQEHAAPAADAGSPATSA